jgi:hypothetical protein
MRHHCALRSLTRPSHTGVCWNRRAPWPFVAYLAAAQAAFAQRRNTMATFRAENGPASLERANQDEARPRARIFAPPAATA